MAESVALKEVSSAGESEEETYYFVKRNYGIVKQVKKWQVTSSHGKTLTMHLLTCLVNSKVVNQLSMHLT